jgi:DNA processing protein
MGSSEWEARLGLSCVVEPGDPGLGRQVAAVGVERAWEMLIRGQGSAADCRAAAEFRRDAELAAADRAGARFIIPGDPEWPSQVEASRDAGAEGAPAGDPLGLWVRGGGDLAQLTNRSIAIVGSRTCTSYGEVVASELAADLAQAGWSVVSGGAFGIDAAAHRGALSRRFATVAVLASGVDLPYPPAHRALFEQIAQQGVVVSMLAPGRHPTRSRFVVRSRLMAALSDGVVVVEAAARSGALGTVSAARSLGHPVMAVPGPVTSAQSDATHRLIRTGDANLVTSVTDVLEVMDRSARTAGSTPNPRPGPGWEQVPERGRPLQPSAGVQERRPLSASPGR